MKAVNLDFAPFSRARRTNLQVGRTLGQTEREAADFSLTDRVGGGQSRADFVWWSRNNKLHNEGSESKKL